MPTRFLDDARVRAAAFVFLQKQIELHGEVLSWSILQKGFELDGARVPLLSQQGIFRPAVLPEIPLSIRTTPAVQGRPPPYDDAVGRDGLLRYRYRGTDARHRENAGLRLAIQRQTPLVYLFGVVEGQYMPVWPVFIIADDAADLCFTIAVDDRQLAAAPAPELDASPRCAVRT